MLWTYKQIFSAEKNHVGGNFLRPKSTAKSRQGSSEHITLMYGRSFKVKACWENLLGDVKNSVKQNNINQIFDYFLLGVKNSDRKKVKKCWALDQEQHLLVAPGSIRLWKSTFTSRSTEYFVKWTILKMFRLKNRVGEKVSVNFLIKVFFPVLCLRLRNQRTDTPARFGDKGV